MCELHAMREFFSPEANMPATRLKSVQYAERRGQPKEWILDRFTLGQVNLIVGTNATGKSRTINTVNNLARMLLAESRAFALYSPG